MTDASTGASAAVAITGFHRSGTSAAARLLHRAGLDLGDEMIGERASNPFGHFEDVRVVALHDRLLAAYGLDWRVVRPEPVAVSEEGRHEMAAFARPGAWGFKDPRAAHFLNTWAEVVSELRVIGLIRHPGAATASLRRRELPLHPDPFTGDPDLALRMWVASNHLLLERTRQHPEDTLLVAFTRLRALAPLVDTVRRRWGLALDPMPTGAAVDPRYPTAAAPAVRSDDGSLVAETEEIWAELTEAESQMWMREAAHA